MTAVFVLCFGLCATCREVITTATVPRYDAVPGPFKYTALFDSPIENLKVSMLFNINPQYERHSYPALTFQNCCSRMIESESLGLDETDISCFHVEPFSSSKQILIEFSSTKIGPKIGVEWFCDSVIIDTQITDDIHTPKLVTLHSNTSVAKKVYGTTRLEHLLYSTKPYMTHTFRWNHGTGINNGLLVADYTLYLPLMIIVDHGPTFSIRHRLLSRHNIDSIHPSSNGDRKGDYARLYQLIGLDEDVKCITMTPPDEINGAKITFNNGGIYPYITLPNSSSIADGLICTFTIQYTPEQLDYIFTHEDADEYKNVLIQFGSDVLYAAQPLTMPDTIPLSCGGHAAASNRAHVWTSPHHRHNHDDFEFALVAMTTYYQYTTIFPINVGNIGIDLKNLFTSYPSKTAPDRVECYKHTRNKLDEPPEFVFFPNDQGTIPTAKFAGFGLTCRAIFLNMETSAAIDAVLLRRTTLHKGRLSIKVYDSMDRIVPNPHPFPHVSNDNNEETFIGLPYRATTLDDNHLPPPHPLTVQFSPAMIDDIEVNYATITMTIQYLSHIPSDARRDKFYLHLLCHQLPQLSTLLQSESGDVPAVITISYGDHTIVHNAPIEYTLFDPNIDIEVSPVDTSHSFVYDRPIRVPSIIIPITARLVSAKPVNVSIRFQFMEGVDTTSFSEVYAVLLVNHLSQMQVYSAGIALIHPMVTTPRPSNYSYRCVEWENMITAYTPYTMALTEDTSKPCPPFMPNADQGTEGGDAEPDSSPFWRTIEYSQVTPDNESTIAHTCYHELSAVCVTPSTQTEGEYDVHPIEQCESLLGSTHLIPCDAVESSELRPLSEWGYSLSNMEASLLDDDKLALTWSYSGDPRLSMSLDMVYIHEDDTTSHPPIRIARNIPAGVFSALANEATQQPTLVVNFPLFYGVTGKSVLLQLTLNGFHTISTEVTLDLQSASSEECTGSDQSKMVDPNTHLCVCKPGYVADVPIGTDNPFVHPTDFTCTLRSQCTAGTEWDPDTARCTCPQNGSYDQHCNPLPPQEAATCDVIPPGLIAPFKTTSCHYGIATDENCEQCTCFKAWSIDSKTKKCGHCRLKDTCHKDNTHDITYLDQYCWVGRCLCKPGFYGTTCQHRVVYGTLQYVNPSTDDEKMSNPSQKSPIILSRKEIQSFEARITGNVMALLGDTPVRTFVHQAAQALSDDKEQMVTSLVIGFGRLDKFIQSDDGDDDGDGDGDDNNNDNDGENDNNMPFIQLSAETENPHDLYHAWEQLQNAYDHQPINNDEQFGDMENIGEAFDPNCVPNPHFSCPSGENNLLPPQSQVDDDELVDVPDLTLGGESSSDNTTTYIIIGVVLGVILLLFALLIIMILYCRKHSKMCFRKKRTKRDATKKSMDGDESGTAKSANDGVEMTHSAPPSSTMSTSSYLPTQVPIEDPTLPPDWVALRDQNTNKVYYSNKVTMQSSWDHPAQPKEEKSAYGW